MDDRLELLKSWLRSVTGLATFDIAPASSDASFRRYYRVSYNDENRIVMDAPPDKEDCRPYIKIARAFASLGLNVPKIYQTDLELGFLLLSDLGVCSYLEMLNNSSVDNLYGEALDALFVLQSFKQYEKDYLPSYSRGLLISEMALFHEWYLSKQLGLILSDEQHKVLEVTYGILLTSAMEQPAVWVHRDYHSRNLMVVEENNPGILDFQDAVVGPVTYDLVSLLRDCYIQWPQEKVQSWAEEYYLRLVENGIINHVDILQFMRWFDLMGIQRHLKAIGIFTRLNIRDGKPGYLHDIPRTLSYVKEVSENYPELSEFNRLLHDVIPETHTELLS